MAHREGITTSSTDWTMIPASSLIQNQKVIEIDGNVSVEEACQVLVENNISSAPVFEGKEKGHYIGMFDYGDVIAYILLVLHRRPGQKGNDDLIDPESFEIKDIVHRALQGQKVPVGMASDLSRKNPFYSILHEATLLSAVEIFACGTHRVSILRPDGKIEGILSQSTVVKYLFENRRQFPEIDQILDKTIRELNLGNEPVIGVNDNSSVLDALSLMSTHGVSSVAVLREKTVLGNISMTDVKHVMKGYSHNLLWKKCFQFVSHIRTQQGITDGQDRLPVFDVRPETSLGFTIAKLLATKAHRVWVVDEQNQATGVVSLTDVIRTIASLVGVQVNERRASMAVFNR
ncbi:cell separation during budding [Mucor circinelloides]